MYLLKLETPVGNRHYMDKSGAPCFANSWSTYKRKYAADKRAAKENLTVVELADCLVDRYYYVPEDEVCLEACKEDPNMPLVRGEYASKPEALAAIYEDIERLKKAYKTA